MCDGQPVFSVALDRPPCPNTSLQQSLAAASSALYGRDAAAVESDIRSALARVEQSRHIWGAELQHQGVAHDVQQEPGASQTKKPKKHRTRKRSSEPDQATLFAPAAPTSNGQTPAAAPGGDDDEPFEEVNDDA
ncbi:MAG: hypothetical protein ACYDAG_03595 [Chloroflexota bacterium]